MRSRVTTQKQPFSKFDCSDALYLAAGILEQMAHDAYQSRSEEGLRQHTEAVLLVPR